MSEKRHTLLSSASRTLAAAGAAAILSAGPLAAAPAEAGLTNPAHKVVIQVSSPSPIAEVTALHVAANLQKAYGMDNVKIEVVAFGPGLKLLTAKDPHHEMVSSLAMNGIRFSACHTTMMAIKHKTGHLPKLAKGVHIVPGGAVRIVNLEQRGYAFLKP